MISLEINELYLKNDSKFNKSHYLNTKIELINEISNQKMNKECFDCRIKEPKYISINNAIFLCEDCAKIHKTFPENISLIVNNNLDLLSNTFLKYLYYGGNANLDYFINYDFPGLQNYSPEILYKTQAMIYYREEIKCRIEGKPKPACPNNIMAYKLVSENGLINIREENKFKNNHITLKKDIINNYYNNFNNTYNTFNNFNYLDDDNDNDNDSDNFKKNILSSKFNKTKYCSLVNKVFFKEMKNLFGKKSLKKNNTKDIANNIIKDNYMKLKFLNSYSNISKIKKKFKNCSISNCSTPLNETLTYRINDSLNSLITKREIETTSGRKTFNNSSISDRINSPKLFYYQRYFNPKFLDNKILNNDNNNNLKKKKIYLDISQFKKYKETNNTFKLDNKVNNPKKKLFNSLQIYKKPKSSKKNLSFELNKKNKINKSVKPKNNKINSKTYLYSDYINNIIKSKNKEDSNNNNISNNSKNINKEKFIIKVKKKNYENISYDFTINKRKPIKVNLNKTTLRTNYFLNKEIDSERKKKALQDKKEQEKLEEEALHNLLFAKKDNDLFSNIICLNNNK